MSQAKPQPRSMLKTWRTRVASGMTLLRTWVEIGANEVIYLVGLLGMFLGLWIWLGLGPALAIPGGILMVTALINGWLAERAEAEDVV